MKTGRQQCRCSTVAAFFIFGGHAVFGLAKSEDVKHVPEMPLPTHFRDYCTLPAIEQFPRPLLGPSVREHSWLMPQVLATVATIIGVTVVTKDYYVPSLYRICERLDLTPDVVGASFMAVGSSAPHLATVIVGNFYAPNDLGISNVVTLSAYNMLFVVALCALSAVTVAPLNWRPFCRDCCFYVTAVLILLVAAVNNYVSLFEALFMLLLYGLYCLVLIFGSTLGRCVRSNKPAPTQPGDAETPQAQVEIELQNPDPVYPDITCSSDNEEKAAQSLEFNGAGSHETPRAEQPVAAAPALPDPQDNRPATVNPLVKPIGANCLQLTWWLITCPVHCLCRATIPRHERWHLVSYLTSVLWISFYSFFMIWMITIIGFSLSISDSLMGLTVVPLAMSASNVISSLAVVKKGYGDMVISNAVGSSVFNVLVGLGLPWGIRTGIIHPGSNVNVFSKRLIYTAFLAFSTVVYSFVVTLSCRRLDKKYGVALIAWHLVIITVYSLYELNWFGEFNPPVCYSLY